MDPNTLWPFLFDVSDVLSSTLDPSTGTLTIQLGDVTKDRADTSKAEVWQGASGICSRPALPTQGKASCQAFHLKRSDHDVAFAYRDLRATAIYKNLSPGDTAVYATSGAAIAMCRAKDGGARQLTTDTNDATGRTILSGVSAYYQGTDGHQHLGGEWRYYGPWGGAWHDPTGYHFRTWQGVRIDAGGFGLPSPIGVTTSTYKVSAGIITLKGLVKLGQSTGTWEPAVKATSLQTALSSASSQIANAAIAIGAAATSMSTATDPKVVTASGSLATAAAALAAAVTALNAVGTASSSSSVTIT
jgi:hypothetical protein